MLEMFDCLSPQCRPTHAALARDGTTPPHAAHASKVFDCMPQPCRPTHAAFTTKDGEDTTHTICACSLLNSLIDHDFLDLGIQSYLFQDNHFIENKGDVWLLASPVQALPCQRPQI